MQVEPYFDKDGYRVWLAKQESQTLLDYFEDTPKKQLAVHLGLHGLRAGEIQRVALQDFREMNTEEEGHMLHVWESKTNYRETPISSEVYTLAKQIKSIQGLRKSDSIVDASKRTIQRWVSNDASAALAEREPEKDWEHLTAHDLRRTWCTHTYWSINGDRAREVVMAWGGWTDVQTFTQNYLGKIPDSVAIDVMQEAELV